MNGEREKFENWLLDVNGLTDEWEESRNCYKTFGVHLAWKAWQARASLTSAQPSDVVECGHCDNTGEVYDGQSHAMGHHGWLTCPVCHGESRAALSTTQQAQSGDVERLVEAAKDAAWFLDSRGIVYHRCQEHKAALLRALQPFTQNKGD